MNSLHPSTAYPPIFAAWFFWHSTYRIVEVLELLEDPPLFTTTLLFFIYSFVTLWVISPLPIYVCTISLKVVMYNVCVCEREKERVDIKMPTFLVGWHITPNPRNGIIYTYFGHEFPLEIKNLVWVALFNHYFIPFLGFTIRAKILSSECKQTPVGECHVAKDRRWNFPISLILPEKFEPSEPHAYRPIYVCFFSSVMCRALIGHL